MVLNFYLQPQILVCGFSGYGLWLIIRYSWLWVWFLHTTEFYMWGVCLASLQVVCSIHLYTWSILSLLKLEKVPKDLDCRCHVSPSKIEKKIVCGKLVSRTVPNLSLMMKNKFPSVHQSFNTCSRILVGFQLHF